MERAVPIVTLTLHPAIDTSGDVDGLDADIKMRCESVRRGPGGGGINVARVLDRLGTRTLSVFPVGGVMGAMLESLVSHEGLPHIAVRAAGETRENITIR